MCNFNMAIYDLADGDTMKYNLVNPSDTITVESDNEKAAIAATLLVGEGYYGLIDDNNKNICQMIAFGGGDKFMQDTFGGFAAYDDYIKSDAAAVADCLLTFKLVRERSSMNDICDRAHRMAQLLRSRYVKEESHGSAI